MNQAKRYTDLTFQTKLLLAIGGLVLLTGLLVIAVADYGSRTTTNALADTLFRQVSANAVSQTKDFVQNSAPVARTLEQLANNGLRLDDLDALAPQLLAFLKANPGLTFVLYGDEATGGYVAAKRMNDDALRLERSYIDSGKTYFTESKVAADGSLEVVEKTDDEGYDPRGRPFYQLAKDTGELAYTPPYMFFSQGVPGISCVVPAKDKQGNFRGVFSVEFDLNSLSEFVAELSVSQKSSVFLFTPDRTLLAHGNLKNLVGKGVNGKGEMLTLADTGDEMVDGFRAHMKAEHMEVLVSFDSGTITTDNFHFFEFRNQGVSYMASTTVFPISHGQQGQLWVVGVVAPKSDFYAGIWRTRWLFFVAAVLAMCVAAFIAAGMARRISEPVQALTAFMQRVGQGDLDAHADFHGTREFRQLSDALNIMIPELRERLELRNSLKLAMDVQKSLLPENDPISPLLDVAGRSKYCDETGGDYYDFIDLATISPTSLVIAVGDVMGHGIPAALVMATARAAVRTSALHEHRLGELMARTNRVLAADNRHHRFMTMLLLMIDANTRIVSWVSGGHDPAIVYDPVIKGFKELQGGDMMLGILEENEYQEYTSEPLAVNSVLVVGTDGVWEMFNEEKVMYGKERLQAVIEKNHTLTATQIAAALETDLKSFRGSRIPVDDVTFVVVKFVEPATA